MSNVFDSDPNVTSCLPSGMVDSEPNIIEDEFERDRPLDYKFNTAPLDENYLFKIIARFEEIIKDPAEHFLPVELMDEYRNIIAIRPEMRLFNFFIDGGNRPMEPIISALHYNKPHIAVQLTQIGFPVTSRAFEFIDSQCANDQISVKDTLNDTQYTRYYLFAKLVSTACGKDRTSLKDIPVNRLHGILEERAYVNVLDRLANSPCPTYKNPEATYLKELGRKANGLLIGSMGRIEHAVEQDLVPPEVLPAYQEILESKTVLTTYLKGLIGQRAVTV